MTTETDPTDAAEPDDAAPPRPTPVARRLEARPTEAAAGSDRAGRERAARKVREGVAVSTKMDKTVVVAVVERVRHPKYAKFMQRTKKLYAHDEANDVNLGDRVRVMETRPLSKLKRWRVVEVLERAK